MVIFREFVKRLIVGENKAMAHPFEKLFESALRKSTPEENLVLEKAESLVTDGYSADEVFDVLDRLRKALLDPNDEAILNDAIEAFEEKF